MKPNLKDALLCLKILGYYPEPCRGTTIFAHIFLNQSQTIF